MAYMRAILLRAVFDRFWCGLWHSLQNSNTQGSAVALFAILALELPDLHFCLAVLHKFHFSINATRKRKYLGCRVKIKKNGPSSRAHENSEENATDRVKIGPQTKMKIDFPFSRKTALKNRVLLNIRETAHDVGFFFFLIKKFGLRPTFLKISRFLVNRCKEYSTSLRGMQKNMKSAQFCNGPLSN